MKLSVLSFRPLICNGFAHCILLIFLIGSSFVSNAQVSTGYTFANGTSPAHVAMAGGTTLASGTGIDDAIYTSIPIGFTFNFNGIDYTTVGVSTNGFIWFGTTNPATNDYNPISSATAMSGVASCFGANLLAKGASATVKYITTGTCPNRVFMVQWFNMKVSGKTSQIDLQITLTEGTNGVELHPYDASYFVGDTYNAQVGLRGASNTDFNNRSVPCSAAGNWAASTAGVANNASCTINGGLACSFTSIYPGAPGGTTSAVARYRFTNLATIGSLTWNGSVDNDWFNAANWTPAVVPTSYKSVVIPTGLSNYPSLSGSVNAFCRNLTIGAGATLTTAAGYTATLTVSGSLVNDGTITTSGTNYLYLTGTVATALSGAGDFTQADLYLFGACATYVMGNALIIRKVNIGVNASLSMNTYNLTILTSFIQTGTINQSTGVLQIEDPACTLTNATFNENTGTTYFSIGTLMPAANQLIPSITYYDLKVNVSNGYTASIGNGSGVTCNNLNINNPGTSGGIAQAVNTITVNGNFDLAPTGNTPSFNLNADVSVSCTTTLYYGIITTGVNKLIINNTAATALAAGPSNTDYTLSYISGNLRRMILSGVTANYDFPLGNATAPHYIILMDNGLNGGGMTYIDGAFLPLSNHTDASMVATEPSEPGVAYDHICTEGVWYLDPNNQPAGGTYDIKAYTNGFAGLVDDEFAVLKRISTSVTGADWDNGGAGATRPATMLPGRTVASGFALRYGLSSFSQFGIATHPPITPMPIELLFFRGKMEKDFNLLEWETATELNNDYFTLERSGDAFNFYELAIINGAGNSDQTLSYFQKDETAPDGVSYYRLKQTDFDGRFTYSNTVIINRETEEQDVINVFAGQDQIEVSISCSGNCDMEIGLYDISGKLVLSRLIRSEDHKIILPTEAFGKGMYLIKIGNGEKVFSKKIIL